MVLKPVVLTDAMLTATDVPEADYPDHNVGTAYAVGDRVNVVSADVHDVYEAVIGSSSGTVTITIASPCVINWTSNGLANDTPIYFTTTGTLPTGITANTVYYVLAATASAFNLAASPGGAAINTSGSQSGTHTAIAGNINKAPADWPKVWKRVSATNRWKLFDLSSSSQTVQALAMSYTLTPGKAVTGIAAVNMTGVTALRVRVNDPLYGVVYDTTFDLSPLPPAPGWWSWFFGERREQSKVVVSDLPSFPFADIIFDFTGTSEMAVGVLLLGQIRQFGMGVNYGLGLRLRDFSRKVTNDFGDTEFKERAAADRADFIVNLYSYEVDVFQEFLREIRAKPCLWILTKQYKATIIYGWLEDGGILINYFDQSDFSGTVQGLT